MPIAAEVAQPDSEILTGTQSKALGSRTSALERVLQAIIVLAGLRCAIAARNLPIGSDGMAYLDVARAYIRHDWSTAVNGYWGPLYSWLIAAMLAMVSPNARYEFAAIRILNFLIFLLCLFAFAKFWRSIANWTKSDFTTESLPRACPVEWTLLGYCLFLITVPWFVGQVTPDVLVASMVLLIAARTLESDRMDRQRLSDYLLLGVLLALGYYTKAILFYFGVFVLAAMSGRQFARRRYRGPILAGVVCVLLTAPYVVSLSFALGRLTVGETGRLNYAWFVKGTETGRWAEGQASFPFFPGPVLLNSPRVFHIPRMEGVTYAPWYDAARFDRESKASLNPQGQLRQLAINLKGLEEEILGRYSALLVCLVILISWEPRRFLKAVGDLWHCAIPAMLIIAMYLLVHLVTRFMIGFLLILWGVGFACIHLSPSSRVLARRVLLSAIAVFMISTLPGLMHYLVSPAQESIERDLAVAQAVSQHGLKSGDSVAVIGDGQTAYWAHWAHLSVVSEVTALDSASFWAAPVQIQRAAVRVMLGEGAKAVVWRRDSNAQCPADWVELPKNSGCMFQ